MNLSPYIMQLEVLQQQWEEAKGTRSQRQMAIARETMAGELASVAESLFIVAGKVRRGETS